MIDLTIRPIDHDDIQLIRFWRNLDHVRTNLVTTRLISFTDQRNWFARLDREANEYFIYGQGDTDVGVVSLNKIDRQEGSCEAGIFCGNLEFAGHAINVLACIRVYDRAFVELGLSHSIAVIKSDNKKALSLNRSLGYVKVAQMEGGFARYRLDRDAFSSNRQRLHRFLVS